MVAPVSSAWLSWLTHVSLLQNPLHYQHVDPSSVELPMFAIDADAREAGARVQRRARHVPGERGQHELVIPDLARQLDQAVEKLASDSFRSPRPFDVHRKVGDVVVRLARIEPVEAGKADNGTAHVRDDDRM